MLSHVYLLTRTPTKFFLAGFNKFLNVQHGLVLFHRQQRKRLSPSSVPPIVCTPVFSVETKAPGLRFRGSSLGDPSREAPPATAPLGKASPPGGLSRSALSRCCAPVPPTQTLFDSRRLALPGSPLAARLRASHGTVSLGPPVHQNAQPTAVSAPKPAHSQSAAPGPGGASALVSPDELCSTSSRWDRRAWPRGITGKAVGALPGQHAFIYAPFWRRHTAKCLLMRCDRLRGPRSQDSAPAGS